MDPQLTSDVDHMLRQLDGVVKQMIAQYEQLAHLARQRHDAVCRADPGAVSALIAIEQQVAQEVTRLEPERARFVGGLASALGSDQGGKTTLTWIAQRIGGASGERLAQQAQELRGRLETVRHENDVVRRALVQLAAHMEGLWRQAASVLNHAKTYGRQGNVEPGPRVISTLDFTT